MSSWNCKAVIDRCAKELWDQSSTFRSKIIDWANEIQEEILSELPYDFRRIDLKKLLPTEQSVISLDVEVPSAPTAVIASGGSLTENSAYKVYVSFLVYDADGKNYIESEISEASDVSTATAANKTINLTNIPTMSGDNTTEPLTIYRRIYMAALADGETEYADTLFVQDIANNTATTLSITAETTSLIQPISDSEIDQLTSDNMIFAPNSKCLIKESMNKLKRYSPGNSQNTSPDSFDFYGLNSIYLYPQLSTDSTDKERTLQYTVLRRPHEFFYDATRPVDLPIQAKAVLIKGVIARGHAFRDRDGAVSKMNEYEKSKMEFIRKMNRQRGRQAGVRDVNGDTQGWEL